MPESAEDLSIRCSNCRTLIPVAPDWRLAQCPACGHVNVRMESDSQYD